MTRRCSPDTRLLVRGAASALATVNGYRPLARRGWASPLAWLAGWVASELPLPRGALEAAGAGWGLARHGWPATRRARLGLGLSAASWVGLAGLHVGAGRSGAHAARALEDALGAGFMDGVAANLVPPEAADLTLAQLAWPPHGQRRRLVQAADIVYGSGGPRTSLDIWHRPDLDPGGQAPVILQVHGGAWVSGDKRTQALPLLTWLAENGWVCVVINYRVGPRATWPDHIVDVKAAIAWIRAHIADHGGDPGFVAVTGGSAGGHLSALAALTANDPDWQPGFEDVDTSVQAAVPLYGIYDMANHSGTSRDDMIGFLTRFVFKASPAEAPELWRRASPLYRVHPGAPPMFVLHGANDALAPPQQARAFATALKAVSRQPVVYAELPLAQHAYDLLGTVRNSAALHSVACFLAYAASRHRDQAGGP